MPPPPTPTHLLPSVLDRLIDPDPTNATLRRTTLNDIIQAVNRDMESLLNTRQTISETVAQLPNVSTSIVAYGLPDLAMLNANNEAERLAICRQVQDAIRCFEPRLTDIRAILVDSGSPFERTLHLRIEARLNVDPAPELVFDTVLELATGHYNVEPANS